jgi:hypothetical protein
MARTVLIVISFFFYSAPCPLGRTAPGGVTIEPEELVVSFWF